ncbi:TspO/MBR family protein [Qipengyuania sediminis]|uniref:TspO/MBR family protein n=1 Tax=Qipengyuania sediminis TaxID=1532023 RepID=UPI00105A90DD|nr:TspO/MBR family protein [Qipengyuania sediminis]
MNFLASRKQLRASLLRWALVAVPLCMLLGFLVGRLAGGGPGDPWFDALQKPAIYPPAAAFPITWSILYALMGFALALVGSAWGARGRRLAIAVFAAQFLVSLAWTPVFFAGHQLTGGLVVLLVLDVLVIVTLVLFWRIRKLAGLLLVPYLAWILFATVLNYEFLRLNPEADGASGAAASIRIAD